MGQDVGQKNVPNPDWLKSFAWHSLEGLRLGPWDLKLNLRVLDLQLTTCSKGKCHDLPRTLFDSRCSGALGVTLHKFMVPHFSKFVLREPSHLGGRWN